MTLLTVRRSPNAAGALPGDIPVLRRRRPRIVAGLYLAPLVLVLTAWIYGPMAFTAILSVLDWNLTTAPSGFVGLGNYLALFAQPEFPRALWQTLVYALALLPFSTVVPLVLAVMLWQRVSRWSGVYRALLFLPVMLAPVAHAVSWKFLLNPLQGLANAALEALGLAPVNWLGDPLIAPFVIVAVTTARVVGFNMLIYSAALATIDRSTLNAARLDGANPVELTRFIVIPQLVKTTVLLALLSIVMAGQWVFNNVSVLTQGGPDGSTDNVFFRIYTLGFTFFETGLASAAAMVVLMVFLLGWLVLSLTNRRRNHDIRD
jgi:multiple sugar transport system permease protein